MKKKLVIILVSMLMFAAFLPVAMTKDNNAKSGSGGRDGWVHTYDETSKGYSVDQADDGGYIITGYKAGSSTGSDVLLIKTYADGTMEWEQTFGSIYTDIGHSVQQTDDGGYIITGETRSEPGYNYDVHPWLIKTYADGTMEWNQTYVRSDDYTYDIGYSVQQTDDGGYIIVGMALQLGAGGWNVWLIKTYADGTMEWNQTFDRIDEKDEGYSVDQTDDGGYIITGKTHVSGTAYNVWLIKTYADGTMEWDQTFGGSGNERDQGLSVQQTGDDGYIISGDTSTYSTGAGSDKDVWLIKTDQNGNETWNQTFGGLYTDIGHSVDQTDDGGYIITGETRSFGLEYIAPDGWLIKTDQNGNEMWNQTFGAGGHDICFSGLQADDGAYIMTGYTNGYAGADNDVWLIKYDPEAENHPPETPDAPDGPSEGGFGVEYDFTAVTTDPDGDDISYRFRWGDGTESDWTLTAPSNVSVTKSHSWDDPGFFDVQVQAKDLLNTTDWSPAHIIHIINHPPATPNAPNGPDVGAPGIEYEFNAHTYDPDGHEIAYNFSWGNGEYSGWTEFLPSGYYVYVPYVWDESGTYEVRVQAKDHWNVTDWSSNHTIVISNQAPEPPEIDGPEEGFVGDEQTFSIVAVDPDGHQLRYYVDWDDGSPLEEFGPYNSNVPFDADHTWDTAGDYNISVTANDSYDESSVGTYYIEIISKLEIGNITGGLLGGSLKVNAVIKNIADTPISDIDWNITLEGGIILIGAETNDTITSLEPGEEVSVKSDLIIGFGGFLRPLTITVEAREEGGSSGVGTATGRVFIILLSVS